MPAADGLLRFHQCAFNARDLEALVAQAAPDVACFCDGEYLGAGTEVARQALLAELDRSRDVIGRLVPLDGEAVLAEFDAEGGAPRGALRIAAEGHRVQELRIEHDERLVQRLAGAR